MKRLLLFGLIGGGVYLAVRSHAGAAGGVGGIGTLPNTASTYDARDVVVTPRASFRDRPFGFPAQ